MSVIYCIMKGNVSLIAYYSSNPEVYLKSVALGCIYVIQ